MENPLNSLVGSLVKDNAPLLMSEALGAVPELRDLLQGKPVELVITLQLRTKAQ